MASIFNPNENFLVKLYPKLIERFNEFTCAFENKTESILGVISLAKSTPGPVLPVILEAIFILQRLRQN